MGYAGQVSLGHAGFYGLGAYVSAVLSVRLRALAVARHADRRRSPPARSPTSSASRRCGSSRTTSAMATLGIGVVLHLAFVQLYRITGGSSGLAGILPWDLGPLRFTTRPAHYVPVWVFAARRALGRAQPRQRARRPRAARARRERGGGGGDGRRHRGARSAASSCCPRCTPRSRAASTRTTSR